MSENDGIAHLKPLGVLRIFARIYFSPFSQHNVTSIITQALSFLKMNTQGTYLHIDLYVPPRRKKLRL